MEIRKKFSPTNWFFVAGLCGILLTLLWFSFITPQPKNIRFIHPDLDSTDQAPSTVYHRPHQDGLYWLNFDTEPMLVAPKRLHLRTFNCVHQLSTSHGEWNFPSNQNIVCNNKDGVVLRNTASILSQPTTWYIAGSTSGGNYGVILDVDWTEWPFALGLTVLMISLGLAVYGKLPTMQNPERVAVMIFLAGAFFLRFWFVFIMSSPQMSLFSDMGMYFDRGWELDRGIYHTTQTFQPIGYTLLSLWVRHLGGFPLLNWLQVFLSWGVVFLIFLMVRERFGKIAGLISLLIASTHIPLAALASMHMAEMTYAFLITFTLWCLLKVLKRQTLTGFFIIGFLLAFAFYFKGNHAFFIPAFSLWLLYRDRKNLSAAFLKVSMLAVGCLIVMIPHVVWTGIHYDKPQLGPTAGALNFVEGKCPSKDNRDSRGARWMSPLFGVLGERTFKKWPRPFTDQAYFWKEGFKCIEENPAVLLSSFRYIYYLFAGNTLWPIAETPMKTWYYPWEIFFLYGLLPFALIGALSLSRKKDSFTEVAALMMLTLFFTVWFFKSENRFRVPFDAIIIVWSSAGLAWALEKVKVWVLEKPKPSSLPLEVIKASSPT
ncbi:glycosyltransferase family 39 protein [Bdellovibrio sp. HCB-162]|uniref:glycosyltransferase family 39 protein n=1 Tax=Bdellovibrio sp. HCB-162 TaxID=3394234 RepID=UPI0039BC2932